MLIEKLRNYLNSEVNTPYFFVTGDQHYQSVKDNIYELGLSIIKLSDYCGSCDRLPDLDGLIEYLTTADLCQNNRRLAVVGLGEYLALKGKIETHNVLNYMKDLSIGTRKVIFLLRGVAAQVREIQKDPRFDERRCGYTSSTDHKMSITIVDKEFGLTALTGIKVLLSELEHGKTGDIKVNTLIDLNNSLLVVKNIKSSYESLQYLDPNFNIPSNCGNEDMWNQLLRDISKNNSPIIELLKKYGFDDDLESDFYNRISGASYKSWLFFIALKMKTSYLKSKYLQYVINKTTDFKDFKYNFINEIIEISSKNENFKKYYIERKKLVKDFPEADIASFAVNNRKNIEESIYKLTDNSIPEREEIVAWVSKHGMIQEIDDIYPALAHYMNKYQFKCGNLSDTLTDYFEKYKNQKIKNAIDDKFLCEVNDLAKKLLYNRLSSREEIISNLDKDNMLLIWVDALGVEYLAYITYLAKKLDLSLKISIARAKLPSITSINRGFYDDWSGEKEKVKQLDDIKHNNDGGYNFENNVLPIHLAKELEVIEDVMNKIATKLTSKKYKHILIVSDHGASRLAVIRRKEEKYDTDTVGKHSGRCCEAFGDYELSFATEENGYLVLADYGRFKGSRAANVEVHGGASLEEVVIPIIELTLKNNKISIELMSEKIVADFRSGTYIKFFSDTPLEKVTVHTLGKIYSVDRIGENHYDVQIADIKKAGQHQIEIYSGDNLIKEILIDVQSKIGSMNVAFDDIF